MSRGAFGNNTNSFDDTDHLLNVWDNYPVTGERSQLLAWLSPLDPRVRHHDIQERRIADVGKWLIQTEEFRSWHDRGGQGSNAVLFCYGDPGVGKTFIR